MTQGYVTDLDCSGSWSISVVLCLNGNARIFPQNKDMEGAI